MGYLLFCERLAEGGIYLRECKERWGIIPAGPTIG